MTAKADNVSHAIITGVNKCGTTSVFRYLSDHPDVCASNVKETRFFVRFPDGSESLTYENYRTHFQHRDQEPVLLEASPTYFSSGKIVGARINEILPGERIVIFLRSPITKFFSNYRSALVCDNLFRVENKTRTYRRITLQKTVFRANMCLEKVLSGCPGLRKSAQSLYRAINERRQVDTPQIGSESYDKHYEFYHRSVVELRSCLAESYGITSFPGQIDPLTKIVRRNA